MKLICLMLALACISGIFLPVAAMGEDLMNEPCLVFRGNAPEAPVYPLMEDYGEDLDAFFAAFEAADRAMAGLPVPSEADIDAQRSFLRRTMPVILAGQEGKNALYSPIDLYFPLGILAEMSDGNTRAQILDLLGAADMDQLRSRLQAMWHSQNKNDGTTKIRMASSVWMNEALPVNMDLARQISETYFTDIFQGEMGGDAINTALQDWLNAQTGGLLQDHAPARLDARTILSLLSTIEYRVPWLNEFTEAATVPGVFHAPEGDIETDFMRSSDSGWLYLGDRFSAVCLPMQDYGEMRLILPDEGVMAEALLADDQAMDFLCRSADGEWPEAKYLQIKLRLPKFDVSADLQLEESLQALGMTDAFDASAANFEPMAPGMDAMLSSVIHASRVTVDEQGVTAAAYTQVMMALGMAMPEEEEIDFVLDRPFLFEIIDEHGSILFAGIVNQPNG